MRGTALASVGAAALLATGPTMSGAQDFTPALGRPGPAVACANVDQWIPYSGLQVTSGQMVAAGDGLPEHCLVEGVINRRTGAGGVEYGIGFQLRLPTEWNGRFLLQGGGGLNGTVRPALGPVAAGNTPALARGFAVASHDSGHQGPVFDASFYADQRAALDFAETSVLTVTMMSRMLLQHYYQEMPHHSYMTGCSTGGREGMLASQRYPELFDGIVIGAPAMRPGNSNMAMEHAQVLLNATLAPDAEGPARLSRAELDLFNLEVLRQCDAVDGIADGMISNVEACRSFDPSPLQCAPGQSEGCITADRLEAVRLGMAGPRQSNGRPTYVAYPWDTGITYDGPGLPGFLPVGQGGPLGPPSTARSIDIDERIEAVRWDAVGRLTDTPYWTNLSTYLGKGSKLIYFHGVSDPWFSAFDTWDYFQRAREANGPEVWDDAARFYMVPGMMHCGGGNAFDSFDLLGPLVDWVEGGEAPAAVRAEPRSGPGAEGGLSMPLCPHPSYPHFTGGEAMRFGSYECRMPTGSTD